MGVETFSDPKNSLHEGAASKRGVGIVLLIRPISIGQVQ